MFSFRKNSEGCNGTTISVSKTLKLHMNGVIPLIKNPLMKVQYKYILLKELSLFLKIVHMIRDPKAQVKSHLQTSSFKCSSDIPKYCTSVSGKPFAEFI